VLLDDILDLLLLEVFELILLHLKDHLSTTAERRVGSVGSDGEGSSGGRFPDVLFIVVVLGDDGNLVGNEVGRVESNTELSNHGDISTGGESLHEGLGSRLGDCSEVVNEISLGHSNTRILDGESTSLLVGSDTNEEVLLSVELSRIGKSGVTDLVEGIGRVGDQFTKEDFLV